MSFYEILKPLFDDQDYYNRRAQQYNPYNGSDFWKGLGAVNKFMDERYADRARNKEQELYKQGTNNKPNTGIGADSNGVYGIGQQSMNVGNGIGVDANGIHGLGQQSPSFGNITGQIPDSPYPVNNNSMGNNPLGGLGKLATTSGLDLLTGKEGGSTFNSILGGNGTTNWNANPSIPNSLNGEAQRVGDNVSARDLSQYLGNDYNIANWMQADEQRGVDNPYISALRYETKIAPLVQAAKEDELRNAFATILNQNASEQDKMNATALISYMKKDPYMAENQQMRTDANMYRQGYVRDRSDVGNNILSTFKDYEEGEQWMSPDGTGDSRTQCSNFVSDVLRKVGLDIGSPNGDELMKQFGKAYHTGLDGIQAGDVLNFKDHVGFYVGNGQYIARNSSGGVHQGTMEEAVQAFGQPLGYASVREYAGNKPRYTEDQSKYNLLKQKHDYTMEEIAARNGYRNAKNGATTVNSDGYIKGSGKRNNALINGINWYANTSDRKPTDLMKNVVDPMADVFVDKLVQFKNEDDALEQLAYELVGGEKFGSSGMTDEQLAEIIGEAAMKAGNNERIRYETSGKNAIKQKLLNDILPRMHGQGAQTSQDNGTPPTTGGSSKTPLSKKAAGYDENAKGGSNKPKPMTKAEMQERDPMMFSENGMTEQEEFRNKMMNPIDWGSILHATPDKRRDENLTYKW